MASNQANTLSQGAIAALSAPAVPMYAMMMPLAVFLPPYYADSLGVGMTTVGTLFALGRVFDVLTDPFAGLVMDRFQHVVQRKTWLAIGAVPIALAVYNLFFIESVTSLGGLFFWLLCMYLGWTLMSVAIFSWAAETSFDYHERSRAMAGIQAANSLGSVLVLLLPMLLEWFGGSADVGQQRVQAMGAFILLTLPITIAFAWKFGPPSVTRVRQASRTWFWAGLKVALKSRALRRLLLADLAIGLNLGIGTSLAVFFVEIVLGHQDRAATVQFYSLLAGLLCIPVWVAVANRLEKHRALGLTAVISVVGGVFALLVPAGNFSLYFAGSVVLSFGLGGLQFLPRSIMADVVDQDRAESKQERAGLYFAFLTTTLKIGLGLGIASAFYLAELAGFDPALARTTGEGIESVRHVTGVSSIVLALVCLLAVWRFPLDRAAQNELRHSLQQ